MKVLIDGRSESGMNVDARINKEGRRSTRRLYIESAQINATIYVHVGWDVEVKKSPGIYLDRGCLGEKGEAKRRENDGRR